MNECVVFKSCITCLISIINLFEVMVKVKAFELRKKSEAELLNDLEKYRKELSQLRVSKVSAAPQVKLAKIKVSSVASNTCPFWAAIEC